MDTQEPRIELQGSLWMSVGGENLGGHGRIGLLALIAECGSITQAAKRMGMSYKAAWDAVDAMNTLAGELLVARSVGGKGGGGARLTARGERLVASFRQVEREHRRFFEALQRRAGAAGEDLALIRRMSMATSARNQFHGRVVRIGEGAVNDEVEIEVAGGRRIVATVTRDSVQELGLRPGVEAFALVKASSVILASVAAGERFSARNQLGGTVARLTRGAVNDEVVVELGGGSSVVAIVTHASAQALQLAEGVEITAMFKASSVIVGVPA